jgi:putative ABC transport system permease protein
MAWYHEIRAGLQALLLRRRNEAELAEELRTHLEMEARYNMRQGLTPDEARARAARAFGSVERYKDDVRDERGSRSFDEMWLDLRFAWRSLRRRRAFTSLVVLTLALGIGATTTLFGVVKAVLLAPLPFGRPEGIVQIWSSWKDFPQTWLSYDEFEAWKTDIKSFSDVSLFTDGSLILSDGDASERIRYGQVGANTFQVLGVPPLLGRAFTPEEDRPNGPRVISLGYDLWQRRFGGDASILGRSIQVNGRATTVVGVMPSGFQLPLDFGSDGRTESWMPLATDAASEGAVPGPEFSPGGGNHGYFAVARLAPGATVEGANRELTAFVANLIQKGTYPQEMQFRAFALSIDDQIMGRIRPALLVLFGAVGFVLLIACANVAGLLLVRGEARRRELAVRVALGAGRRRLTRLLLLESAVLAVLGGGAGVGLASLGIWLVRRTAPAGLPRIADARLDPVLLVFALGVAAVCALLCGVLPALQAGQVAPVSELKEGGRSATAGAGRLRWRQMLVSAEVALAVILVIGAGLMIRSVASLFAIDAGIDPKGVLAMRLSTPSSWYQDSVQVATFWNELQRRVSALPQVTAVGAVRQLPLASEMGDWGLDVEGYTPPPNSGTPGDWQVVTPGYFEAMGVRLISGRLFDARDELNAPLSLVINRRFAEKYFAGRTALGGRVRIGGSADSIKYTVVGIVENVRHNALTREVKPQFYATMAQFARAPGNTSRSMHLVIRTPGDPRSQIAPVQSVIRQMDPRLPISEVRTMEDVVGTSIAEPRFAMELLGLFGVLALVLSAIGVFGIVSQVVASRSHEFGIRAALGATPGELARLSLGAGLSQTAVGLSLGVALALVLTRAMGQLLHGVTPTDPLTFVAVVLVTGVVALAASLAPARRAARTQPQVVLHDG